MAHALPNRLVKGPENIVQVWKYHHHQLLALESFFFLFLLSHNFFPLIIILNLFFHVKYPVKTTCILGSSWNFVNWNFNQVYACVCVCVGVSYRTDKVLGVLSIHLSDKLVCPYMSATHCLVMHHWLLDRVNGGCFQTVKLLLKTLRLKIK